MRCCTRRCCIRQFSGKFSRAVARFHMCLLSPLANVPPATHKIKNKTTNLMFPIILHEYYCHIASYRVTLFDGHWQRFRHQARVQSLACFWGFFGQNVTISHLNWNCSSYFSIQKQIRLIFKFRE